MSQPVSGYLYLEVEEIVKESERAFWARFHDGEYEWIQKAQVDDPLRYSVGDKEVTMQLKGDSNGPAA